MIPRYTALASGYVGFLDGHDDCCFNDRQFMPEDFESPCLADVTEPLVLNNIEKVEIDE